MNALRRLTAFGLIAVCTLVLVVGCASKPPKAYEMSFEMVGAQDINPTAKGRPSPLAFMVYQLREPEPFLTAEFDTLFTKETTPIAESVVDKKQYQIRPGRRVTKRLNISPDTRYIGVVAAFREQNPGGEKNWLKVMELVPSKPKKAKRYETKIIFSGQEIDLYMVKRGRLSIF